MNDTELDLIKNILRQGLDYQSFIRGATSHGFHLVDSGVAIISQMDSSTGTISFMATRDGRLSTVMYRRKDGASKVITLVDNGRLCS